MSLNHSGPYEFLVDTGSEITIMEPSLAAELHLERKGSADVVTGVRHTETGVVSPEVIEVGSHAFHGRLLSVASLAQFQARKGGIRGILGEDLLILPVVRHAPPAVHGAEEHLDVEGQLLPCLRHRFPLDYGLTFYRTPHVGKTPTAGSFVAARALPQPGAWNQAPSAWSPTLVDGRGLHTGVAY